MENRTPAQQQMTEAPLLTEAEKDVRIRMLEQRLAVMEQEKRQRRRVVLVICAVIWVMLLAAAAFLFFFLSQDKQSPQLAEDILQAMLDGDAERAFALFYPGATEREELETAFDEMRSFWHAHGGQNSFTVRRTSFSINTSPTSSRYETEFVVNSGEARFSLYMVRIVQGESAGVVSFRLS